MRCFTDISISRVDQTRNIEYLRHSQHGTTIKGGIIVYQCGIIDRKDHGMQANMNDEWKRN